MIPDRHEQDDDCGGCEEKMKRGEVFHTIPPEAGMVKPQPAHDKRLQPVEETK